MNTAEKTIRKIARRHGLSDAPAGSIEVEYRNARTIASRLDDSNLVFVLPDGAKEAKDCFVLTRASHLFELLKQARDCGVIAKTLPHSENIAVEKEVDSNVR